MAYDRAYLRAYCRQQAAEQGFDPDIGERQIDQESGFNPDAVSPAGALGIAQFMPATAAGLGLSDPMDPIAALQVWARYMRRLLDSYNGNYCFALAAYNAGSGAVNQYGGIPPYEETQRYVRVIMDGRPCFLQTPVPSPAPVPPVLSQGMGGVDLALLVGAVLLLAGAALLDRPRVGVV